MRPGKKMPNKISKQSVREAVLPVTVWGMVHCSGKLGSKYRPLPLVPWGCVGGLQGAGGAEWRLGGQQSPEGHGVVSRTNPEL